MNGKLVILVLNLTWLVYVTWKKAGLLYISQSRCVFYMAKRVLLLKKNQNSMEWKSKLNSSIIDSDCKHQHFVALRSQKERNRPLCVLQVSVTNMLILWETSCIHVLYLQIHVTCYCVIVWSAQERGSLIVLNHCATGTVYIPFLSMFQAKYIAP